MTLVLISILMGLAAPSWQTFLRNTKSRTLLLQLQLALQFARQEALLRREVMTLCGSRDQKSCTASWQEGVIVFIDYKQDGSVESPSHILRVFQFRRLEGVLHWRAFPLNKSVCQFLPLGTTNHENGSFWYCPASGAEAAWALVLSQSGRWRIRYPDHGQIKDDKGIPLSC